MSTRIVPGSGGLGGIKSAPRPSSGVLGGIKSAPRLSSRVGGFSGFFLGVMGVERLVGIVDVRCSRGQSPHEMSVYVGYAAFS